MGRPATAIHGETLSRDGSILAALCQTLLLFALTTLPTPLYGDYERAFGFSVLTLTLIYATYVAGNLIALFVLGRLSDQVGRLKIAVLAIAAAALADLLFALASGIGLLFAGRLMTGLAAGLSSGTAVAWLRELHGKEERETGLLRTVALNMLGLGIGPLLAGLLAERAAPFVLPYLVHGALLAPLLAAVVFSRETVADRRDWEHVELGLRIGVPKDLRAAFAGPGLITFVIFSLVGFYSALAPGLMSKTLHITGHAASGSLVFLLFLAGTIAVYAAKSLKSRKVMLWGAGLMLPTLALLVAAEKTASLAAFIAGSVVGGVALGLAYRGTLEEGASLAPKDKRAEVISMLFVCGNLGLAIPVIGVGVLSTLANPEIADLAFACVIALVSLMGLSFALFSGRDGQARKPG